MSQSETIELAFDGIDELIFIFFNSVIIPNNLNKQFIFVL